MLVNKISPIYAKVDQRVKQGNQISEKGLFRKGRLFFCAMKAADNFYKTKKWLRLRAAILQRDEFECQLAKMRGRHEPAVTVHHIFPRSEYPEYQWAEWNLISLSFSAHNMMHVRDTDKLTERGELLRQQVAKERGIGMRPTTTLVVGNPGTGKTHYVMRNMRRGVCYDLDAIAGAIRLRRPKEENYKPARWIANSLARGFVQAAHVYVDDVWMIRTAPKLDEVEEIGPTKIVILYGNYGNEKLKDRRRATIASNLKAIAGWARANNVELKEINADDYLAQKQNIPGEMGPDRPE